MILDLDRNHVLWGPDFEMDLDGVEKRIRDAEVARHAARARWGVKNGAAKRRPAAEAVRQNPKPAAE